MVTDSSMTNCKVLPTIRPPQPSTVRLYLFYFVFVMMEIFFYNFNPCLTYQTPIVIVVLSLNNNVILNKLLVVLL